jgi:HPt (histidine-containing phosphotransfer) domain-containing protein
MPENHDYTVTVDKELEDLIPVFIKNRHQEVESLRAALDAADFEKLRQLGHRMKGVGSSYGFKHVSAIGKQIEECARRADRSTIEGYIADYAAYLSKITIVYE